MNREHQTLWMGTSVAWEIVMRTRSWTILASMALLAGSATPAAAQFYYPNPYINYTNPYSSQLYGSSSVIDSLGQYQISTQQTYLMQQQVKQAKLETRRKNFDEWRYERDNTPTQEEERERSRQQELQRSRNDPPLTEIWSGKALNDILLDTQRLQGMHAYAQSALLDPSMLKRINVTTGQSSGSIGVLRDGGRLRWPLALTDSAYEKDCKLLEKVVPRALQEAQGGEVQAQTLRDMIGALTRLKDTLRGHVADVPSTQYIEAKRYLTQLDDAVKVLQGPNASKYFGQWVAKGNTVAELVQNMTEMGLKFAPATRGDESNYTALHRVMANYDMALSHQIVAANPRTAPKPATPSGK